MVRVSDVTERYAEAAGCDSLYEVRDAAVGLHAFVALHDLSRGPGYGGIRRRAFAGAHEAVHEVVGLAEAMTLKTAFAGLAAGGGKSIILSARDPADEPALGPLYLAMGQAIEELGGTYFAGPDVGTSEAELQFVRQATQWVSGVAASPSRSTAKGVIAGCRAALAHVGLLGARGVRAAVIGVGSVGREVARFLHAQGIELVVSDIDGPKAEAVAAELGARVVSDRQLLWPRSASLRSEMPEVDLLVPCAMGQVVTSDNVDFFRCRIICGAANNQLETSTLAHDLAARDILYVPDFAVNAGAVIEGVLRRNAAPGEALEAAIDAALADIGPRIGRMLELAVQSEVTPLEAALMMIDEGAL